MSDSLSDSGAYVRKFAFRPFEGIRRGRVYRLWAIAKQWCAHEWRRSKAVKFLIGFLIFMFILQNMFILFSKDFLLTEDPSLTTNDILQDNLISMIRDVVSFGDSGSEHRREGVNFSIGGTSIFILIIVIIVGSGLIADDISNQTNEIYYSKLEKHEYIIGKFAAFFLFGNIILTLPYVFEFILLVVGLGGIDIVTAFPVLIHVILFTEIITITYSAIILAFSSLTRRRLYAGLTIFMLLFVSSMIIGSLIESGEEYRFLLFDVLTVLLLTSYIMYGVTEVEFSRYDGAQTINLADGVGLESWMVLGALLLYILVGFSVVVGQVYWRHSK